MARSDKNGAPASSETNRSGNMQITIARNTMLKALSHTQGVVEARGTIPILSNVLLQAAGDTLRITATDMDLTVIEDVDATVAQEGAVTVSAQMLHDVVRKLPEDADVGIVSEDDRLAVRAGRSSIRLVTLPETDFPNSPADDLPHSFSMPSDILVRLINRTHFAMSSEETRHYLNGLYLHAAEGESGGVLRVVATDGHRLARADVDVPDGAAEIPGVIVPRKTVAQIRRLLDETDGTVEVSLSDTRIRFRFGDIELVSKLIDGTFPDYNRVIPTNNDKNLEVSRKDFVKAVDLVSTISTEQSRAVKFTVASDTLKLTANNPESGSGEEELDVVYKDDRIEIGFNSRYLLDIAQEIGGGETRFLMSDEASPTVVQDVGDESTLYVLMPMRV